MSVSVAVVHAARVYVCVVCARVCVRVCTRLSGEIAVWCVTPDYGYTFPSFSPCALQINVMQALVWAPDRQTSAEGFGGWWQRRDLWWRPPFCHCRLAQITPSAIFLLCMLMKQREGVMRKDWWDFFKKEEKKRRRVREKRETGKAQKEYVWKRATWNNPFECVWQSEIREREQKHKCVWT